MQPGGVVGVQNPLRPPGPPGLVLAPCHPAVVAKGIETGHHDIHPERPPPCLRREQVEHGSIYLMALIYHNYYLASMREECPRWDGFLGTFGGEPWRADATYPASLRGYIRPGEEVPMSSRILIRYRPPEFICCPSATSSRSAAWK